MFVHADIVTQCYVDGWGGVGSGGVGGDIFVLKQQQSKFQQSRPWQRKFGLPNAPAHHCIDEMSPTVELKQSDMTKQQQKTLTKASKVLKRPAALKRKQSFLIVGGDNSTESEISRVKGQMRRTNMLGRISPRNAQVQQFAVKRLLEKPGLMPLVTAFAEYRRDRKSQMGIQPGHAFQIEKDNAWLPWKKGVDTPPKTNTTKPSYTW